MELISILSVYTFSRVLHIVQLNDLFDNSFSGQALKLFSAMFNKYRLQTLSYLNTIDLLKNSRICYKRSIVLYFEIIKF